MRFIEHLKNSLSFDYRSLALYRFFIGWIVVADVLSRVPDLENFYTDLGLVPRSLFVSEMTMPWSFSLHLANGTFEFIVLMFSLHLILGLMLVVGLKTRWAMLGAFIMAVSVHNRNWLVNNGGDDVLRAILFISIFLPLNRFFSIDSALAKKKETTESNSHNHFSSWGLTFILQVFLIYFVSYILKDHDVWRKDFTAHYFSSRLDIFVTPFGVWLRQFDLLGNIITIFSIFLEWSGPLLLVFSFIFGRHWWKVRFTLVVIFILFHIGIFFTMNIGLFTFICEVMWISLIPGPFWDKMADHFRKKNYHKISIYYDGDCGFCQKGVRLIREFFLFSKVPILPAQDNSSIFEDMKKAHSWVVVNEKGKRFFYYDAFIELVNHSFILKPFQFIFSSKIMRSCGGRVYHWVSHHRPLMGKFSQWLNYVPEKNPITTLRWLSELSGAFMFITILSWNLSTIKKYDVHIPFLKSVTRWIHLYQEWNMFAPYPKKDNIWVEIPAVLSDGSEIELLTGSRDIYSIKEKSFYEFVPNEHWRKFYLNMSDKTTYARYYGGFLCRQWNMRNIRHVPTTTLKKFEIIVYSQMNLLNNEKGGINQKLTWKHWCFDEDFKRENSK